MDADDDGIGFWANDDGNGFVRLRKAGGNFVTFEPDFGKSIVHNFHFETNLVNAVDDFELESGVVQVFPNPARDMLTFTIEGWSGAFNWSLRDGSGREVNRGTGRSHADVRFEGRIPLSEIPSGVHLLILEHGNQVVRRRVVVF